MTRIIAGTAGGRSIAVPPGSGTRPTSDRVREAIFSALQARDALADVTVLDLYAGSGALGLEAVSRGARSADLVESDRKAADVITSNLRSLGLPGRVHAQSVQALLSRPALDAYGVVFLDPPYAVTDEALAANLAALASGGWLAPDAIVVVERGTRSPEPNWPQFLEMTSTKKYGETTIWYAAWDPEPDEKD